MDNTLKRFFDKIEFNGEDNFNGVTVKKVVINKKKESWDVYLSSSKVLDIEPVLNLIECASKGIENVSTIKILFDYENINDEDVIKYFRYYLNLLVEENPSLISLSDTNIVLDGNVLKIDVISKIESELIRSYNKAFNKWINSLGFASYEIEPVINTEIRDAIKNEIVNSKTDVIVKKEPEFKVIMGESIKSKTITSIKDIMGEENNVTVEAYIFGIEEFISNKSNFKILTLKISDKTDSILAKIFCREDDDFNRYKSGLKDGKWYKFRGYVKNDNFAKDLVFNIRDIEEIPSKTVKFTDDAPVKRVELHAHTMMSQMDGVTKFDLDKHTCELVSNAINAGYRAVAVTDHNGCQAFPIIYEIIKNHNKGIEDPEKRFKGLYGTELTLVDDTVKIVLRSNDLPLRDTTYVVFDTETTGFNAAGGDQMIEIGAVKIKNGEIIDRFDELINPNRKLPQKITDLTCITDEMLKDKDNEENVTKRFLKWTGDCPMVAHNAKFDVSFMEMSMKKYDLGEFTNTVIDTLELSRAIDQEHTRHSLSALVKRYDVPFDEDAHHRADYDAEGTALVFHKMCEKLIRQGKSLISDLDKLISKEDIHKFGRTFHFNAIVLNKTGLKNLFKIVSLANTTYLYKTPRIPRSVLNELREGLIIGSGCYESEVFIEARSKDGEELTNIINFYDYVEVQPLEVYNHLIQTSDFANELELANHVKKVVNATKEAGKIIVATGDVHHFFREDKIYREIIINQKVPGGGRHPLAKQSITKIPSMHFRNTEEMLNDFKFLGDDLAYEIVVTNTNKVADMVGEFEVIIDTGGTPFSPRVKADDGKSYLDCPRVVTDLVYEKATSWYGDDLPLIIEERIAKELYGDSVYKACRELILNETSEDDPELERKIFKKAHEVIFEGIDAVKSLVKENIKNHWSEEDGELNDAALEKKLKKNLGGIIGGGFDPIYLIAQRLVKHSNDEGFLVGSRGSVGSSFVATMMGITEVNPLEAHYRCTNCKSSFFEDENGEKLSKSYSCGIDLPDRVCPNCGEKLYKDGQDMPFATFLGFNADKVPDIDLNFSELNQASTHEYTKVLFGVDNVYRAGTIGTVAEKTAYGFVKGYVEDKGLFMRSTEIERLALGCTGVKRTTGQHPGGIVVVPDYMDVFDFTPFQFPADDPNSAWRTTHFGYHSIEEDLLKLDILGHSDPTQLRMIQDLTKKDVTKVPLDDKETMSIFSSTEALGVTNDQILCPTGTLGIPEFGTNFTIGMVAEIKPTTFAELIKIAGLSHGTDVWLGNARDLCTPDENGVIKVPFKDTIGCRDDIMVYLMQQGVEPIKAFKIMEFVRKGKASKPKEKETWEKHKQTMIDNHIPDWYIESCHKIKYMFPKAHAAAYVISAFRIAWFKVHMPVYFYASWLTSKATDFEVETMIKGYDAIKERVLEIQSKGFEATNKELGVLECLKVCLEATARGIKFLPIDLYDSPATTWGVYDENSIRPPFLSVDGLGETVANTIVNEREKGRYISVEDLQSRGKVSQTLIEKLRTMGVLEQMPESSQLSLF
ncbi:MAG: PolC-type DNA polymerase III [Bacilli bacterium]